MAVGLTLANVILYNHRENSGHEPSYKKIHLFSYKYLVFLCSFLMICFENDGIRKYAKRKPYS